MEGTLSLPSGATVTLREPPQLPPPTPLQQHLIAFKTVLEQAERELTPDAYSAFIDIAYRQTSQAVRAGPNGTSPARGRV